MGNPSWMSPTRMGSRGFIATFQLLCVHLFLLLEGLVEP